jgi:hypothetical protein
MGIKQSELEHIVGQRWPDRARLVTRQFTGPGQPNREILPLFAGRGTYVGTTLYGTAYEPGWWGEGQVKFYLDGESDLP